MTRKTPSNLDGEKISKALNILLGIINDTDDYNNLVIYMKTEMNLNIHPKVNDITSEDSNKTVKRIFNHILHKSNEGNYIALKKPLIISVRPAPIMYTPISAFIHENKDGEEIEHLAIEEIIILLFVFLFTAGFSKYHLRRCKNEKCNKVFYQFKTSGQHFCSPKCR